jgi:hypothetical protein
LASLVSEFVEAVERSFDVSGVDVQFDGECRGLCDGKFEREGGFGVPFFGVADGAAVGAFAARVEFAWVNS